MPSSWLRPCLEDAIASVVCRYVRTYPAIAIPFAIEINVLKLNLYRASSWWWPSSLFLITLELLRCPPNAVDRFYEGLERVEVGCGLCERSVNGVPPC